MRLYFSAALLLCITISICPTTADAQFRFPYIPQIAKMKQRKLMVALLNVDPEKVELAAYANELNSWMRELIPEYWPLHASENIIYVPAAEAVRRFSAAPDSFALLSYGHEEYMYQRGNVLPVYDHFCVSVITGRDRDRLLKMGLPAAFVGREEVRLLMRNIASYIEDPNATMGTPETRLARLKELTLLFPKGVYEMTDAEVQETYKATVKIVSVDEIITAVAENRPGVAYITAVWSERHQVAMVALVEASTGHVLSLLSTGGVKISFGVRVPGESSIRTRTLPLLSFYDSTSKMKMNKTILGYFLEMRAQVANF